jgi:hypothetical protein
LSFGLLPLRSSSVLLPIFSLGHWFFGSLVFWTPCMFWLLIPCQMYSCQGFSPILWTAFLIDHYFCCAELFKFHVVLFVNTFEFYLGSHCLYLLIQIYSLHFPALASKFHVLH